MRGFLAATLLCSAILFPTFAFSAPPTFSEYEVESNLSYRGTCDAGQTELKQYEDKAYLLIVITTKDGAIYYVLNKNSKDDDTFFVKESGHDTIELDIDGFVKRLGTVAPNEVKRAAYQKNDCSFQKVKK